MDKRKRLRTSAELLADQLVAFNVAHVFCVPGKSGPAMLDAFDSRDITVTVCRQESGAAMMAEALGKTTGRPGVCLLARGPGAAQASAAIQLAQRDSTPMIVMVDQVTCGRHDRETLRDFDCGAAFSHMTKWTAEIANPGSVPDYVARAFHAATSGRPGPVVLVLPEDMLSERATVAIAPAFEPVETWPGPGEIERLIGFLAEARRPFLILGGSRWSAAGRDAIEKFAERFALPVATSFRRAHLFDPLHGGYAGDLGIGPSPKLITRLEQSDLVMLVGGRISELPSPCRAVLDRINPASKRVHVHPDAEEFGRVVPPQLAIHATPDGFATVCENLQPPRWISWRERTESAHADYLEWTRKPTAQTDRVDLGAVMVWLRENLTDDAVLCNGSGRHGAWIDRFYRARGFDSLVAPVSATLGYGIPAGIALKRLDPKRTVIAIAGGGDFLINAQEFATAVHYGLSIIVIVCDSGVGDNVPMEEEREYPVRINTPEATNPDFSAYARAFGGYGTTVEKTADFGAAFAAATASHQAAIIHLKIDPDAIRPGSALGKIRQLRKQTPISSEN
jgi:acetolactate synthase-1/2/3 large subunit